MKHLCIVRVEQQSSWQTLVRIILLPKIEAYTENFFDRIGRIESAVLNLPNEIKDVVNCG